MDNLKAIFLIILHVSIAGKSEGSQGHIGLDDIVPNSYDYLHPPRPLSGTLRVNVSIDKLSIRNIDESEMTLSVTMEMWQSWVDDRLMYPSWATGEYQVLDSSWIDKLWNPTLYFVNSLDGKLDSVIAPASFFWIRSNKSVYFYTRVILKFICEMNLVDYPHDEQVCSIQMGSAIYTTNQIHMVWTNESERIKVFSLQQFEIYDLEKTRFLKPLGQNFVSCIELLIHVRRRTGYYVINVYIPTILIVIMSMLTFWIPHDAVPARITLGVTSLLTIITKQYQASMPNVSYIVAMNIWLSCCIGFVFLSLLEYGIVITLETKFKGANNPVQQDKESMLPMVMLKPNGTWTTKNDWMETENVQETPPEKKKKIFPKRIDLFSRIAFPVIFSVFCMSYWLHYG